MSLFYFQFFRVMTLLSLGTKVTNIAQFQFCWSIPKSHSNESPKNPLHLKLSVDHSCNWLEILIWWASTKRPYTNEIVPKVQIRHCFSPPFQILKVHYSHFWTPKTFVSVAIIWEKCIRLQAENTPHGGLLESSSFHFSIITPSFHFGEVQI